MKLIDKDAVVEEIERRRKLVSDPILSGDDLMIGERNALFNLLSFINTLEVKEVDLDKSARYYLLHEHISPLNEVLHQADLKVEMQYHKDIEDAYKAGFELGLKAQKGE